MAIANQGYRRDLDLLETPNDFTAIDNLGGVGISFDLQIIQNNLRNISTAGFSTLTDGFFDFGTTSNFVFTNDDPIKFNTTVSFGATTFNTTDTFFKDIESYEPGLITIYLKKSEKIYNLH